MKIIAFLSVGAGIWLSGAGCSSEPPIGRPQVRSSPGWTIQTTEVRWTREPEAWTPAAIHVAGKCPTGTKAVHVVLYAIDQGKSGPRWFMNGQMEAKVAGTTWKATMYPRPWTPAGYAILQATSESPSIYQSLGYEEEGAAMVIDVVEKGS
jgi:hypothetical protein